MKKICYSLLCMLIASLTSSATSGPGLYPSSLLMPCITPGQPVHDTITFINYTTVSGYTIDSLIFDSIANLPAGLTCTSNKPGNVFHGGDTGLIFINGTTTAAPGQYSLQVFGQVTANGSLLIPAYTNLGTTAGIYYWLRIACSGGSCIPVDSVNGKTTNFIAYTSSCAIAPIATITASGATTFCQGGSVTLSAPYDSSYTYHWSTGAINSSIVVSTSGSYTVTVYSGADSAVSTPVSVVANACATPGLYPSSLLMPCITAGQPVNDTITFINFTTVLGYTIDSLIFDSIANLPAGLTCTSNKPGNVFYGGDTGLIFIQGTTTAAPGQYSLQVFGQVTANGSLLVPAHTNLGTTAGIYYWLRIACSGGACLPVDSTNGKTSIFIADTSCGSVPTVAISPSGNSILCVGSGLTLTASGTAGSSYLWSTGQSGASINVTTGGNYSVTATHGSGTASATVNVYADTPPVALFTLQPQGAPHVWDIVNQCTGNTALTYLWSWGDSSSSTGATPSHTYDSAGYYNVCVNVSDSLGCSASYCDTNTYLFKDQSGQMVEIHVLQYPLGISPAPAPVQQISYYSGAVHFSEAIVSPADISLYDVSGRLVMTQSGYMGSAWPVSADITRGVYIIHLQNSSYSLSKKLLIIQ